MSEPAPDVYAMLESSFQASPHLRQTKRLPLRSDDYRTYSRAAAPLKRDYSYTTQATDDTDSTAESDHNTPLPSPGLLKGADSGLPPTPPTASQDGTSAQMPEQPPLADSVRNSLISHKSSLSTPVNARSPPTPDPSPPRTNASNASNSTNGTNATLERPPICTYPSSRADSFQTAREDPFSSDHDDSRSVTPANDRLSTVEEDRGLGLAFEHDQSDVTPTNAHGPYFPATEHVDSTVGAEADKGSQVVEDIPDREWNTDLMRNVTVRRKRRPDYKSPAKGAKFATEPVAEAVAEPAEPAEPAVTIVEAASPTLSNRARRASSLRERVEASHHSPVTPSIENFAQSIGWPSEGESMSGGKHRDSTNKRLSTASVASTVVSAHVIITPPRRTQTLRHSGRNMAYRRDISAPSELGSGTYSNRNSIISQYDDVPPRRLLHKRTNIADRSARFSTDSDVSSHRIMSPSLSLRSRTIDSSAHTQAHQESLRNVLQPAADILSRHSTIARSGASYHKRVNSAPEATRRTLPPKPRNFTELRPSESPRPMETPSQPPLQRAPSPTLSPKPRRASPTSRKGRRQEPVVTDVKSPGTLENIPPNLPGQGVDGPAERDVFMGASHPVEDARVPSALTDRVRRLLAARETAEEATLVVDSKQNPATSENLDKFSPLKDELQLRQGAQLSRPVSWGKRASLHQESVLDDRVYTPEMKRRSQASRPDSGDHGRVSFDRSASRSASRTEEHANARHLYSQSTPFSQFSDTVEVTEATAVSIYPHNNNSVLVVQQSRGNSLLPQQRQLQDVREVPTSPTPPFVDADEALQEAREEIDDSYSQPTLTFEPSTPPMQSDLPQPDGVESPLENPRDPPEPPKINFIPPTPMEELEKELVPGPPGPPERSDSHPQRRLSVLQRARRYSDNLITPLFARASNNRSRYASDSHGHTHRNPSVPSVNDEDGTLHPFWRPRGFWDGFEDGDSDSDEEGGLPQGGDTSDIEDPEPEPEPPRSRRASTLGNKLKGGFRGSGGFLIGNSLGVERAGTNKRRHHVTLPPHFRTPRTAGHLAEPKVLIQAPTQALGRHRGGGVTKRRSSHDLRRTASMPDNMSTVSFEYEQSRREGRGSWRQGKSLPGLKKYHVQYIGISGVKERLRERRTEKRREKIRRSIGSRYYVDPVAPGSAFSQ
ncbi:hypothetical protein G6011_04108 [Alternaria panax]|uniref:Uncharacterized protein n=1 Tax=Alternaria panax TaxID=48097 RepID=A0AAD4IFX4_9PLEO|nr:hypothetical protein G6011_04108 [Alternaria panax]